MALTNTQLYRIHVENLRSVTSALDRIQRPLNSSLAEEQHGTHDSLLKTTLLLSGTWAECRLLKLAYEPNGFNDVERSDIRSCKQQFEKWKKAVELGFRRKYNLPRAKLENSLPITQRGLYAAIQDLMETELKPVIEMRNTLAHGQWARPLNSRQTNVSQPMISRMSNENALSVKHKRQILGYLAQMVHDLVVGGGAFERDFNQRYRCIENTKRLLSQDQFERWQTKMIEKYQRGLRRRRGRPEA